MSVAAAVAAPWHRAHIYKALAAIVFVLIALQYLLSGAIDRRSIETIFTINTSRPPHRALVIYGPSSSGSGSSETQQQQQQQQQSNDVEPVVNLPGAAALLVGNLSSSSTSVVPINSTSSSINSSTTIATVTTSSSSITTIKSTVNASTSSTTQASQQESRNSSSSSSTTAAPNSDHKCPQVPPNLVGPLAVSKSAPEVAAIEKACAKVKQGGRGAPETCDARYRVAIVVPFRDRFQHLMTLLYNLHPLLLRQQLDYQIFVVEQEGNGKFNRAMLMNVGYVEALKERPFDCFIFHDVDLLPEDDRNLYSCPEQPRHMSVAVDKFMYRLPYSDLFGGVSAMTTEHFRLVNGFSNVFWGWGGEDDDMANRIKARGLHISRYPANIARYKMLTHKKEKANPKRYEFLKTGKKRFVTDGLSNLQYEVLVKKKPKLYTWFLVRLTPPNQPS